MRNPSHQIRRLVLRVDLVGSQGPGVLSICPVGGVGPGGVGLVWGRHELPGSCGSYGTRGQGGSGCVGVRRLHSLESERRPAAVRVDQVLVGFVAALLVAEANGPRPVTTAPSPPEGPIKGGIKGPLEGPIHGGPAVPGIT
jgi:hypothetical protein